MQPPGRWPSWARVPGNRQGWMWNTPAVLVSAVVPWRMRRPTNTFWALTAPVWNWPKGDEVEVLRKSVVVVPKGSLPSTPRLSTVLNWPPNSEANRPLRSK